MFNSYLVRNGDTLESVANKFSTNIKSIQDLNNIYSRDLRVNEEIIVPSMPKDYFDYYIIEKGDNLYNISKKYNINPSLLAALNGLNMDDYIYPNQELLIPKNGYSYYITKDGDTIDEVIKIFNSNNNKFFEENETIYLMPGQLLVNKKL